MSWRFYTSNTDRLHPGRTAETYDLYRCNSCGLVKLWPEPLPDQIKTFYPPTYLAYQVPKMPKRTKLKQRLREGVLATELGYPYDPVKVPLMNSLLKHRFHNLPHFVPNGRALDVGAGSGKFLNLLKELEWDTYGLEMNEKAYSLLTKQGHKGFQGTIEEIALPESYFDFVSLFEVIEHLRRPNESMKQIFNCLKSKGQLFLSTPNMGSFLSSLMGSCWYPLDTPRHLQLFDWHNLKLLLEKCGFVWEGCRISQPADRIAHSLIYRWGQHVRWTEEKTRLVETATRVPARLMSLFGLGDAMFVKAYKP